MWKSKNGSDDLYKAAAEDFIGSGSPHSASARTSLGAVIYTCTSFLYLYQFLISSVPVSLKQELAIETTTFLESHVNIQFCNPKGETHKNIWI